MTKPAAGAPTTEPALEHAEDHAEAYRLLVPTVLAAIVEEWPRAQTWPLGTIETRWNAAQRGRAALAELVARAEAGT